MPRNRPALDHTGLAIQVAEYLHAKGLAQNIHDEQVEGELPAIYLGGFPPQDDVDRAIAVIGPWQNNDDSDLSTIARVLVAVRSKPWEIYGLSNDCLAINNALHHPEDRLYLTATQEAFYCLRVLSDPPAQDTNHRWTRVDTYSMRLQPPSHTD